MANAVSLATPAAASAENKYCRQAGFPSGEANTK